MQDLSPTALSTEDVAFLKEIFPQSDDNPDHDKFKSVFYRKIDSLGSPQGRKLRLIEEQMFKNYRRDLKKGWGGSKKENQTADKKIR